MAGIVLAIITALVGAVNAQVMLENFLYANTRWNLPTLCRPTAIRFCGNGQVNIFELLFAHY